MNIVDKVRFLVSDTKDVTYLKEVQPLAWFIHVAKSWVLLDCTVFMTCDENRRTVDLNIINWRFAKQHDVPDMKEHRRFLDGRKLWRRLLA